MKSLSCNSSLIVLPSCLMLSIKSPARVFMVFNSSTCSADFTDTVKPISKHFHFIPLMVLIASERPSVSASIFVSRSISPPSYSTIKVVVQLRNIIGYYIKQICRESLHFPPTYKLMGRRNPRNNRSTSSFRFKKSAVHCKLLKRHEI